MWNYQTATQKNFFFHQFSAFDMLVFILAVGAIAEAITISVQTNPTCVGGTVQLKCEFPSLLTRTDAGYLKYISSIPDWRENGNFIKLSDSGYSSSLLSSTEATLTISSTPNTYVGVTRNYSCLLFLNNGQGNNGGIEESNRTSVVLRNLSQPEVRILPEQTKAMMILNRTECSKMVGVTVSNAKNATVYRVESNQSNITVSELKPATTYTAQVVAVNDFTSVTTTTTFTTMRAVPSADSESIVALSIGVALGTASFIILVISSLIFIMVCSVFCSRPTHRKCTKRNKVGRKNVNI